MAAAPVGIEPRDVHQRMAEGEPILLVCAYDELDKARAFRLAGAITLQELEARLDGMDRRHELVFYVADPDDTEAKRRAIEWSDRGFKAVRVLTGGVDAWRAAGLHLAQPAPREGADHTPELAPLGPKPTVEAGQEPLPPRHERAASFARDEGQGGGSASYKARDLMTRSPEAITAESSVEEAARRMRDLDVGALPVCDAARRFVGMITDRDITVRVTAEGRAPARTRVEDVMSGDLVFADEEAGVEEVARLMQERGVRRVPIMRRPASEAPSPGDLVGIISLDDLATDLRVSDLVARALAGRSA